MYAWVFKNIGWKFFAAGAGAAVLGAPFVRPAAVGLAKVGLMAKDMATETWNAAKTQTSEVLAEAQSMRQAPAGGSASSDVAEELRKLREEVASMKSQLASHPA
jgi:hypothetical protein